MINFTAELPNGELLEVHTSALDANNHYVILKTYFGEDKLRVRVKSVIDGIHLAKMIEKTAVIGVQK